MQFELSIEEAKRLFPEYDFISALPPSVQKAAFHVRDTDGRELCLKVIAPEYSMARLEREILALQSLSHPNVAKLVEYTFSTREGSQRHYVLEEYIEGNDLSECLVEGSAWELTDVAKLFVPIADGLAAVHELNIVHRDLKPSNIRVREKDSPVIIDFGLARHLDLPDLTRTEEGAAIGTPAYFAPEQFTGTKHDIDRRTDLFALGVMVYQAAVGHHPFLQAHMSYADLRDAVCTSDDYLSAEKFAALPADWRMIIRRLLHKERIGRPFSAMDVSRILKRVGGLE